ncbi:MAG: hypothetical protein NC833_07185 [Candidatus Omnitrophica bacterium]|nr:hypothetical protein [Candidatus Omnitrophota bacterium]
MKKCLIIFCIMFFVYFLVSILKFKNRKIDINKLTDSQIIELLKSDKTKNLSSKQLVLLESRFRNIPSEKIKDLIDKLHEDLKYRFEKNIEKISYARLDKKIEEFYKSSPERQEKILDEEIDRLQQAEAKREILIEYSEFYEGSFLSSNEPSYTFHRRRFFRKGFVGRNPDAILQRVRNRLSQTTPEQRAKRQEFMKKLRERMAKKRF